MYRLATIHNNVTDGQQQTDGRTNIVA